MNTPPDQVSWHERPEPRPWRSPEDARGWRVVGRGRGAPQPPPLGTVEVDFDRAQSDWLRAEAEHTGPGHPAIIRRLVERARAGRTANAAPARGTAPAAAVAPA